MSGVSRSAPFRHQSWLKIIRKQTHGFPQQHSFCQASQNLVEPSKMTEPAANLADIEGRPSDTICEGEAKILKSGNEVFYNKAQVTNRDLSVAILKYFVQKYRQEVEEGTVNRKKKPQKPKGIPRPQYIVDPKVVEGPKVLEGLAATGLRSLRYALEIPGIETLVACDLDEVAVGTMKKNIELNGEQAKKIIPIHADARLHMLQHEYFYEAIDLDPYGSPVQFLDSAVQSVKEGGLLMVTATDMAVLCGTNGEACHAKYGIYPLHKPYCHEMALRILLACIEKHANRYKRYIVPVLSLSIDFYIRIFVRIHTSPMEVKASASKLAYVYQSVGCSSFYLQKVGQTFQKGKGVKYAPSRGPVIDKCPETGSNFYFGGPIWADPIHKKEWIQGILEVVERDRSSFASYKKLKGLLTNASEELPDCPLYVDTHDLCRVVGTTAMSLDSFASAVINAGFRASTSHCNSRAIKTDAPWDLIWDIVRTTARKHPSNRKFDEESYVGKLLAREITHNIVLSRRSFSKSRQEGMTRFPENPDGWGPMKRHGTAQAGDTSAGLDVNSPEAVTVNGDSKPLVEKRKREGSTTNPKENEDASTDVKRPK